MHQWKLQKRGLTFKDRKLTFQTNGLLTSLVTIGNLD